MKQCLIFNAFIMNFVGILTFNQENGQAEKCVKKGYEKVRKLELAKTIVKNQGFYLILSNNAIFYNIYGKAK